MSVSGQAALPNAPSSDITISIVIKRATTCRPSTITALLLAASMVWEELGFPAWTAVGNIFGLSMPGEVGEGLWKLDCLEDGEGDGVGLASSMLGLEKDCGGWDWRW
jgi:hypothetical protein